MKRLACIDLGTNTFHLLICETNDDNGSLQEVFRERQYVILAENGIEKIGEKPIARAKQAIDRFKDILVEYTPDDIRIIGTAALRTASNGTIITDYITNELKVTPEIIHGDREAILIYQGTRQIVNLREGWYCIMDIGGGSVEFIVTEDDSIKFMKSFPVGVMVLFNQFHHSDPIGEKDTSSIRAYLTHELKELTAFLKTITAPIHLIGASGSYEVLQNVLEGHIKRDDISRFRVDQFDSLLQKILPLGLEERLHYPGIPEQRAKLIVVAFLLIDFILNQTDFSSIIVSPYALKEGLIAEMILGD